MKKSAFGKVLAFILTSAMVLSVAAPVLPFAASAEGTAESGSLYEYSVSAFTKEQLSADGWVSTGTDSDGTVTQNDDSIFSSTNDFYWRFNSNGSVQGQQGSGNIIEDKFGSIYQNLTYTGKALESFQLTLKTDTGKWKKRGMVSIGVKNPGDLALGDSSPEGVITITTNASDKDIEIDRTFTVKGAALVDGTKTCAIKTVTSPLKWSISVKPGKLTVYCNSESDSSGTTYEFALNEKYTGGYVQLTSPVSYTSFFPITLTEINDNLYFPDSLGYSKTAFAENGWVATKTEKDGSAVTQNDSSIYESNSDYWWRFNSEGSVQGQGGIDDNFGKAYQNLTYTGKELTNLDFSFKVNGGNWCRGFAASVGVKTPGDLAIDESSPENVISFYSNETGQGKSYLYQITAKGAALAGGTQTFELAANNNSTTEHSVKISVKGDVLTLVLNGKSYDMELNDKYTGGYVQLTLPYTYTTIKAISIFKDTAEYIKANINGYSAIPDGNGGYTDEVMKFTGGARYDDLIPERAGYSFLGYYYDAAYTNAVAENTLITDGDTVYAKWSTFGDVTADGATDIRDLVHIKKLSAMTGDKPLCSDLNMDGENAGAEDVAVLRRKLLGAAVTENKTDAYRLVGSGIVTALGRSAVLNDEFVMDNVNAGFVLKGNFAGDVTAKFDTNRAGNLLNVSVDGGENKVIECSLTGETVLASGLEAGEHTIEVINGTSSVYVASGSSFTGTLRLKTIGYTGAVIKNVAENRLNMVFFGDSITCGEGSDTTQEKGYKASNSYYTYASVLGRMLNANVEVFAREGAKTNHFGWSRTGDKAPVDDINWLTSLNLLGQAEYDTANHQADVVVINLGTNDDFKNRPDEYIAFEEDNYGAVPQVLRKVRQVYPNAAIIWTLGSIDYDGEAAQIAAYKEVVEKFKTATDDSDIYFCDILEAGDHSGYDNHPSIDGHSNAAAILYQFMIDNNIKSVENTLSTLASVSKKK